MRTTLVLEDTIFEKAKRKAAEMGMTLSELTSMALKTLMMHQLHPEEKKAPLRTPVFGVKGVKRNYTPEELAALRDEGC